MHDSNYKSKFDCYDEVGVSTCISGGGNWLPTLPFPAAVVTAGVELMLLINYALEPVDWVLNLWILELLLEPTPTRTILIFQMWLPRKPHLHNWTNQMEKQLKNHDLHHLRVRVRGYSE